MAAIARPSQNLISEIFQKTEFLPSPFVYYTCYQHPSQGEKERWSCLRGKKEVHPVIPGVTQKEARLCVYSVKTLEMDTYGIREAFDRRLEAKYPNHGVVNTLADFPK